MEEVWKDVPGYEGCYQISNFSEVRSLDRFKTYIRNGKEEKMFFKGKILKPVINTSGYLTVSFRKNSSLKNCLVHRLLAEAFIPNPENKPEIDHINGNRTDNRLCNLRWCTHSENMLNPIARERYKNARLNCKIQSKPVIQIGKNGKVIAEYPSYREAFRKTGINHIYSCCIGKRKSAGGYIWKYAS